jgi:hypothetical protein
MVEDFVEVALATEGETYLGERDISCLDSVVRVT